MAGEDDNPVTERRLATLEKGTEDFRTEVREGFKGIRDDLRADRAESRNRTLLALAPIALASLAIAAKVLFGVEVSP